jgi:hypothetical protein
MLEDLADPLYRLLRSCTPQWQRSRGFSLAEVPRDWLVKLRSEKGLAQAVNLAGPSQAVPACSWGARGKYPSYLAITFSTWSTSASVL